MSAETATATEQPKTRSETAAPGASAPMPASPTPGVARRTELGLVVMDVRIEDLERGPGRNIRELDPKRLEELTASIKQHGVLEPVLIREAGPRSWELVSGFRRTAAAKAAGLRVIPARVLDLTAANVAEVQLTENLQREDLSEIEEARAFKAYLDAGHTQQQLATRIGKSQPYVANRLALLPLPKRVHELVQRGDLSASHAEILARVPKEADEKGEYVASVAAQAVKQGSSVVELQRKVSQDVDRWRKQVAIQKEYAKAKAPLCPACKKPPTEKLYGGLVGHGDYSAAHQWSPATGRTEQQHRVEEEARWRANSGRGSRAPARSRPKPVDCRESPFLRSGNPPTAIVNAILKDVGPTGLLLVEYDQGRAGGAVLRLQLATRPLGDVHVVARPVAYSTGEQTQYVVQDPKAAERKVSKSRVLSWEQKRLAAPRLKPGKPAQFDPMQLKGAAGIVTSRLAKIRTNPELLELARHHEAAGKHRAAVLDYIDEQLLGRGHDSYSSMSDRRL